VDFKFIVSIPEWDVIHIFISFIIRKHIMGIRLFFLLIFENDWQRWIFSIWPLHAF